MLARLSMKIDRVFADTNLFLRYLTNDVPEQANAVDRLLVRAMAGELALVTNGMVIAEIVWTLESFYRLERTAIKDKVLAILNTPGLEVVDSELVLEAIIGYSDQNVDFIDAFNGAWMVRQGVTTAYAFDQKQLNRPRGITVKVPGSDD